MSVASPPLIPTTIEAVSSHLLASIDTLSLLSALSHLILGTNNTQSLTKILTMITRTTGPLLGVPLIIIDTSQIHWLATNRLSNLILLVKPLII